MATAAFGADGRAMSIGRVFSRAFAAIGAAPGVILGTALVLGALPTAGWQWLSVGAAADPGNPHAAALLSLLLPTASFWWVLYLAAQAVIFQATVAQIDRRPQSFGAYASGALRALLPLIGLSILLTIAVSFGFLIFFVPGVIMALTWSVAAPALVVERTGMFGAFGRSGDLTRGARWRILGAVLLILAIYVVATLVLSIGSVVTSGLGASLVVKAVPTTLGMIASAAVQTGLVAVWSAVQAALYVDLRDDKDGPAGERLADIFA